MEFRDESLRLVKCRDVTAITPLASLIEAVIDQEEDDYRITTYLTPIGLH